MIDEKKFKLGLFLLRASVLLVMVMWTLDKFIKPAHTAKVFEKFYLIPGLEGMTITGIGIAQAVILLMFFFGIAKTLSYGAVLLMHAVSTFTPYAKYLSPYDGGGLIFFAAWPMLAACIVLFMFRNNDSLLQFGGDD